MARVLCTMVTSDKCLLKINYYSLANKLFGKFITKYRKYSFDFFFFYNKESIN